MVAKFELKKSPSDKFIFNLLAANGQVILTSEQYASRASALGGIEAVRQNAAQDRRFGRLSARDGSPYFTVKAPNGQVLAQSQMYPGAKARDAGIDTVQAHAPQAAVDDQTGA